jgi:hypothetical protein
MRPTFKTITSILAARYSHDAGQGIGSIAQQAKVSTSTVRRWLKITEHLRTTARKARGTR